MLKISPSVLAITIASTAFAQDPVLEADGVMSHSSPQIQDMKQYAADQWTFVTNADGEDMLAARQGSILVIDNKVRGLLRIGDDEKHSDVFEKILIVDEEYKDGSYKGQFRVITNQSDEEYLIDAERHASFETGQNSPSAPAWVLLVPGNVDADGAWSLSAMGSAWQSNWKIPFRDGNTQFIPATTDADDVAALDEAYSLADLGLHFSDRYSANDVLFVGNKVSGELEISYWSAAKDPASTIEASGPLPEARDATALRGTLLDHFWGISSGEILTKAPKPEPESTLRYRFVGHPRIENGFMTGFVQILSKEETQETIETRLSTVEGLSVSNYEDHRNSVLLTFGYAGSDIDELISSLSAAGFTSEMF